LSASLEYLSSPLISSTDVNTRVTVAAQPADYYIEVYCSWDNENWFLKNSANITVADGNASNYVDLEYCIFMTGNLYTKVLLYGTNETILGEFKKFNSDTVYAGVVEAYDWYKFSNTTDSGQIVEGYISAIGANIAETTETIYAISKSSDEDVWCEYILENGEWTETGVVYDSNPIESSSVARMSLYSSSLLVKFIQDQINKKVDEMIDEFLLTLGIDRNELNDNDYYMIGLGLSISVDDNVLFGILQTLIPRQLPIDNYYYLRAKCFGDALFTSAFYVGSAVSLTEALAALTTAGSAGALTLATAGTGVGGVVFGTIALSQLAEAGVMAGVSFVSAQMASRSGNILTVDTALLEQTNGYKIRNTSDDILDQMENAGGHTLEKHVSMTNNELINRAVTENVDATSFTNKSTATNCVQQNLRKNANTIDEWLNNSNSPNYLVTECEHSYSIGYGAEANSQNITYGLTSTKIYMVKDSTIDIGFKIVSSYPIF
jgi:hypothetical protein